MATEMKLRKLYVEVLGSQRRVIDMFTALSFEQQSVLRDHVVDGHPGSLCVLSRFLE